MNKYLPFIIIPFLVAGCATTNTGSDASVGGTTPKQAVENALPYIAPAVTLACTVVLEQAVSADDRTEKARMINNVATILRG